VRSKRALLKCGSVAILACAALAAAPAHAQNTQPQPANAQSGAGKSPELVVTAERRQQRLQVTAISATVLDAKALEAKGVTGLTTLQYAAPGIQISDYASANTFNIRGVGQAQVDIDLPSGVVIYRDGVPTLTGYFQNAPYYDMAGVELLRGPQGTFVGKSASAGAVFIRTRDPQLGVLGGDVMLGAGNRDFFEGTGVLNVPLGQDFALRVAYHGESRDSLFDSIRSNPLPGGMNAGGPFTGDDNRRLNSARVGLLFQPNQRFRAVLKVDYDYLHFGSHATTGLDPLTGAEQNLSNPIVNGNHTYVDYGWRASLNMDYNFAGGWDLRSLTGFSTVKTRADWDINGSNPAPFGFRSGGRFTNYSQELDLISPADRPFRITSGLFWQNYINDIPAFPQAGFAFFTDNSTTPLLASPWKKNEDTYAVFGQAEYDFTHALTLQVGGRFSHYEFTQFTEFELFPGLFNIPFLDPPGGEHQKFSENSFDWKVNLNDKLSDTQFLYALVSRGHTPGSINLAPNGITATHTPYHEMAVINYEAGWKGAWFERRLTTQLAVYYQTFDGYQAGFAIPLTAGIPAIDSVGEFKNAKTLSTIYGVEFGAQGQFGDLEVDFGAAYSHSALGSFGKIVNIFAPVYGGPAAVSLAGTTTPFAPEWTLNGGAAYTFHIDDLLHGATLTPRFDVAWRSDSYASLFHNRATLLEGGAVANASLRLDANPWWAELWVTNLADRRFAAAKQNVTGATGIIQGIVYEAPPRLYGIRIGRHF